MLKDHGAADQEVYNRARGLLLLGAIFKSTVPDESDEERRELERYVQHPHNFFLFFFSLFTSSLTGVHSRMVAEAAKPRKKQGPPSAAMLAAQNRAHEARNATNGHGHSTATTAGGSTVPPHPAASAAPASAAATS